MNEKINAFLSERIAANDFPSAVYLVAEKGGGDKRSRRLRIRVDPRASPSAAVRINPSSIGPGGFCRGIVFRCARGKFNATSSSVKPLNSTVICPGIDSDHLPE